jgi:hypothetical protein
MSKHVLIVATRYNTAANYTYEWAQRLRDDLLTSSSCATCVMLDGESLCRGGTSLADAIEHADCVVFYGHGEADQWIALPAGSTTQTVPLVDSASVHVLNGRQTYAACCHSLSTLGRAFAVAFAIQNPTPEFVGYSTAFDFSVENREEFRKIVHDSVRDFILGSSSAATIVSNQRAAWDHLKDAFSNGTLQTRPDALFAAWCAHSNALAVGHA